MKKIINTIWEQIRLNPKKYFFRLVFAFFVIWFLFDDFGLVKRVRMEAEHRLLIERLKVEQKKIIANELRIQHAHDPDSIEKAAREKYNFRKPGETLFIITDK
ncbi:FtsB family cell division protein [Candidatus Chlorobium masyuteum]|uniref:FtsB family cell division protein n=1 Tax=Candidatus Chlorobium masyuteum TaxID=2716876 RepID=UPI001F3F97E2|nr:septum formation initiator family protein [Candidatus Chlorobium masyuteum]